MTHRLVLATTCLAACGTASAQSSTVLYGSLDQAAVHITNIGGNGANRLDPGTTQPDRFGFRITEDLGDGLKANAQLEAGFSTDTGASVNTSFFNRVSVVGLSGSFGSVLLGHQPDLMFDWVGKTSNGFLLANFYAFHPGNFDTLANTFQFDNAIRYTTPTFLGGLQIGGIAAAGEGGGRNTSVGFNYLSGNLRVAGAYSVENARALRGFAPFAAAAALPASGITDKVKNAGIGASLKVAAFNLNTNYTQSDIQAAGRSAILRNADAGVSYAATAADTINLGFTHSKLNDAHWNTLGLMNLYAFSKRTQVYVQGTWQRASAGQVAMLFGAGVSSNERQGIVGVGLHHSF